MRSTKIQRRQPYPVGGRDGALRGLSLLTHGMKCLTQGGCVVSMIG